MSAPLKCRICLEEKRGYELVPMTSPWQEKAPKTIKEIVRFCVPAVSIQDGSQICSTCMWQLKFAYFFIERCLLTEKILQTDSSKVNQLLGKNGDCEDTIKIIIEDDENRAIARDHSYFNSSKNNEKSKVSSKVEEFDQFDDNDNFGDDWLNEAVEDVANESQEFPVKSARKKRKKSITENATESFPEGILEVLDFAATNVMCLSVESDMTKENHDDLIKNGINVINMSSGSTKKKRVIYVGRDLEYKVLRCNMCDLTFGTSCDYADHAHLHNKGKIKLPDNVGFKCNQCDSAFVSNMALREHYKFLHKSSSPHSCKKCNKKFKSLSSLQKHMEIFKDQDTCILTCQKCNRKFRTIGEFESHKEIFNDSEKCTVSCQRCGKEFNTVAALQAHEAEIADAPSCDYVKCKICSLKFTKEDFKTHLLDHSPEYLCPECGKGFYSSTSLRSHQKNVHQPEQTMCHECGKVFKPGMLRQHIQVVHSTATFMCDKCPKHFKTAHYLRKHKLSHSVRQKTQICEKCGKSFYTQSGLREHIALLHLGKAKRECPMCGEKFLRSDYLKRHIKFHEKYMHFSCKVCRMSFSTEGRLLTHETHGHDEDGKPLYIGRKTATAFKRKKSKQYLRAYFEKYHKPCVCPICNKVVTNPQYLKTHYRSHLKLKEYKCEKCDILYQNLPSLKRHMERHKNPNFHLGCQICHIYCKSRSELAAHIANTHKTLKHKCKYCPAKFGRKYLLYSHENMKHKEESLKKKEVLSILTKQKLNFNIPENYVRPKGVKGLKFDYLDTDVDQLMQEVVRTQPTVSQIIPESDFNILDEEYQMEEEAVDELDLDETKDEEYQYLLMSEDEQAVHMIG